MLVLGAGRSRHRAARGLEVLFQRLDRRLLAHQRLADRRRLTLEVAQAMGRAELVPQQRAGPSDDRSGERRDRGHHDAEQRRRQ